MKSFLTIRGNLVLINLVVIGLILWLAISFLYVAVAQRAEAVQLQYSMNTERIIFEASRRLAYERNSSGNYSQPRIPTELNHYHALNSAGLESDAALGKVVDRITYQLDKLGLFAQSSKKQLLLQEQLNGLVDRKLGLNKLRSDFLAHSDASIDAIDYDRRSELFEFQTDVIENLVSLAKSLKYLPDSNASEISNYYALLDTVLATEVALARKNTALGKVLSGNHALDLASRASLAALNQKLAQYFTDILLYARSSENAATLEPIAEKAQMYFQQNYLEFEGSVHSLIVTHDNAGKLAADWRSMNDIFFSYTGKLAKATHSSIELFAEQHGSRANRNFVIDVFLVFLCFGISLASIAINRRVKQYAYHDSLTKLPNRMSFELTLQSSSDNSSQMHAVIFVDLDRFKSINDNYGHSVGDELIVEVAAKLESVCGSTHSLARMGGDEFAIFISNVQSEEFVESLANRIHDAVNSNIIIRGFSLKVGASIGISISPMDGDCGTELLKNADTAMYYNKANKLKGASRFNKVMAREYQHRLQMELDLKRALERDEFTIAYQPKVCTETAQVKSVEALLRWSHPEHGFVSPAQFIPVAEETGLMGAIGQWVLNQACHEIAVLHRESLPMLKVAVNISAQQFCDDQFEKSVYSALESHALSHECLELEVTESIVMTDVKRVIYMLNSLKNNGISIAIDDFGTGYSSLQYLQELPLNTLKIDRAFITALDSKDPTDSVANSIVQLARLFNLEVVAEGVETEEQDAKVRLLGVHHIQGYRYSRPVSARELPAVIQQINEQFGWQGRQIVRRAG